MLLDRVLVLILILQAAFTIGATSMILFLYRRHEKRIHIFPLATSYCLLTMLPCYFLLVYIEHASWFNVITSFVAFGLGNFGLTSLMAKLMQKRFKQAE